MGLVTQTLRRFGRRVLSRLDAGFNALYGWKHNPIYHSGAVVVWSFVVLLATGLYLLLFYRIGSPHESVARMTDQVWAGRWIRSLHRYASDVAVVATAVHALRMFVQGRTWGPRTLAWLSGLALLFGLFVCGWTGYVMVWDVQAKLLAEEGARLFDALPIFSEPIARTFTGERPMPGAFFFLNLFAHIALPVGMALLLWIHVARIARPGLMPPRGLSWGLTGFFVAASVLWPIGMAAEADAFRIAGEAPLDLFYSFWLPASRAAPSAAVWAAFLLSAAALSAVPLLARPKREVAPAPSVVDERLCTGCTQCALDCPYEAISMLRREDGRAELVARVDPDLCVSCGICAGSCAPMGVGPPGRTGRDQLGRVKAFVAEHGPGARDVVVVACDRGAGGVGTLSRFQGAPVFGVACAGSLHTSVIEYLVRSGAGGVLVVSCPPRDCWNREGVKWLEGRVHDGREAELKERVDRRRVRLAYAAEGETAAVAAALEAYRIELGALADAEPEEAIDVAVECEPPDPGLVEELLR